MHFSGDLHERVDFFVDLGWVAFLALWLTLATLSGFCFSSYSFTSESLSLQEGVEILLEFSISWVANKDNLTLFVDKHDMWHTINTVLLATGGAGSMIVLDTLPLLGLNVFHDFIFTIIDANADNSDILAPFSTSLLEH